MIQPSTLVSPEDLTPFALLPIPGILVPGIIQISPVLYCLITDRTLFSLGVVVFVCLQALHDLGQLLCRYALYSLLEQ